MKHLFLFYCFLFSHYLLFAQEKRLLLEAQLSTVGDITLTTDATFKEKGLTEDSKKIAQGVLQQWEEETGLKILTLKEGRNKQLAPLTLVLPPNYGAQLELLKGNLTLTNITGKVEANIQAGQLILKQVNANVRLYTQKGDIETSKSTLTGELVTQSGNIQLSDVDGFCTPLTKEGNVLVKFSEEFLNKKQKETFTYGLREGTIDAVGASGAINFQTGQGNINVQKAPLGVEAIITQKGNIRLEEVAGKLRVITAQGSVFVQTLPKSTSDTEPIWLEAQEGDVTLLLPKEISGFLTLDVAQTRDFKQVFVIESFLDLGKPRLEDITSQKGSLLAKAYHRRQAIGNRNDGQSKREIVIRVRNGNVFIKSL
jgi:hypothetical protein